MNDHDREQLKARLRGLAQGPRGLALDTAQHWTVDGIHEPRPFFENLSLLMGPKSILYVEGTTIQPEGASFFASHETAHPTPVVCDTVFPIPDVYHVDFSSEVVVGIIDLISRIPINQLFNHVKGYRAACLLFTFHDAFEGCLRISDRVTETNVKAFCQALGVSYSREVTKRLSPGSFLDLLHAIEHPNKAKIGRPSWWRQFVAAFLSGFREK